MKATAPAPRWTAPKYTPPKAFAKAVLPTPVPIAALMDIVSYNRDGRSPGERIVIERYIEALDGVVSDDYGNYWLEIRLPDGGRASSMFTAHTDTVHSISEDPQQHKLAIRDGILSRRGGGVLGADDGTGMWLLLNMIAQQVPGIYVFFRDEETGGGGSSYVAKHKIVDLSHIKRCISFDRKATSHVITHQAGGRCCSDAFANALAGQLNGLSFGFAFAPNDGGSFTDSANFTDQIPECTNLSVGYYDQHFDTECQDLTFASRLALALARVDWEALPAERDPKDTDDEHGWRYSGFNGYRSFLGDDEMVSLIERYPDEVAEILEQLGWDADTLRDQIAELLA
ncbi:M28 family peptidase [Pseudomonas sp. RL]|uniref:M28 family peptidase n=1 Tax=Pseudomonas sp. RL TaxID=1452718 RepID=UPI000481C1E4|nr:M28 family peptidase [Pseudomonas sp. RL]